MLALAREEAAKLGMRNVEFREMDAEEPDLAVRSFDAALDIALTRLRELLVPGGRFAVAVGFTEVVIERHTVTFEYPSVENFIEERQATSATIRLLLADASPHDRATIRQAVAPAVLAYRDAGGVLRVPNETLCVVGKA